jgi:molecular chaperone GrpE
MNTNPSSTMEGDEAATVMEKDLQSLEAELSKQRDLYLRMTADFDNFRKRTAQDTDRRAAAQKEGFIRDLLPVLDNLERALSSRSPSTTEQLREGVQMTLQQVKQLLHRHGIELEESLGKPFNPHWHEAVATRQDHSKPDQVVLETYQQGYRRGNEVFRPAKVVVNHLNPDPSTHNGA